MKVRIIQLINNFYKDHKSDSDIMEYKNRDKQLGEYCSFGYFDAVRIEESRNVKQVKDNLIWETINQTVCDTFDAYCSRRNLICIIDKKEKDQKFWEDAVDYPYLFISLVRVVHDSQDARKFGDLVDKLNKDRTVIAYFSYNHSEIIIVKLLEKYAEGLSFVLQQRESIKLLNMYSIFSVRENMLNDINKIESEKVEVRLHIMVKNDTLIEKYLECLVKKLCIINEEYKTYNTLGSCDLLFEIKGIDLKKILPCYVMGNILTHSNSDYQKAVFNIETEFIVEREILENCRKIGQLIR